MDAAFRAETLAWKGAHRVGAGAQCALTLHLSPAHPGNIESPQVAPNPPKLLQGPQEGRPWVHFHLLPPCSPTTDPISPTTPGVPLVSPPTGGTSGKRDSQHGSGKGALVGKGTLTLRFPSAVIRSRLQVPQKCSDMDVMKLSWPWKPGILKAWGEQGKKGSRGDGAGWATHSPLGRRPAEGSTPGPQPPEDSDTTHDLQALCLHLACLTANLLRTRRPVGPMARAPVHRSLKRSLGRGTHGRPTPSLLLCP